MTEAEWMAGVDPLEMLESLCTPGDPVTDLMERPVSDRRLRLLAVHLCRLFAAWPLVQTEEENLVWVEEVVCDIGLRGDEQSPHPLSGMLPHVREAIAVNPPLEAVRRILARRDPAGPAQKRQATLRCDLLREVVGNPFRKPTILHPVPWIVANLAMAIYDARDWAALPVLADALEEYGCCNPGVGQEVLAHLRLPGHTHARGCWAVDLVLGKE